MFPKSRLKIYRKLSWTRNSSAFAFVTQLITNALNLYLSEMNERNEKEISGLDFYENLNTLDDPYGDDN